MILWLIPVYEHDAITDFNEGGLNRFDQRKMCMMTDYRVDVEAVEVTPLLFH